MKKIAGMTLCLIAMAGCGADDEPSSNQGSGSLDEALCLSTPQGEVRKVIPEKFQFDCTMLRSAHFSKLAKEGSERTTRQAMRDYSAQAMPRAGASPEQAPSQRDWARDLYDKLEDSPPR